jgi:transcription initiation factor TFIIE subunit alpha
MENDFDEDELLSSAIHVLSTIAGAIAGELGSSIIKVIGEKGQATDEEIAEYLGVSESEIRKIIWVLSTEGLVKSKKEVSESGWITFYWTLPVDQVDGIILGLYRKIMDRLEKRIEYESQNIFYWCGVREHRRYTFSEATDLLYRCGECGRTLMPYDNTKLIAALKYVLSRMRKIYEEYFKTGE